MPVYLIATLDTKGREIAFVQERLRASGVESRIVDAGCQGTPAVHADVPREAVFEAAGSTLAAERERADRGSAVTTAAQGAARIVIERFAAGDVTGVLAIGGSAGTTIGAAAMRALPLGVPKVMVSTLASGQVRPYVGDKDVFMLNAVTDIAGLNRITRAVLDEAARAMAGLVTFPPAPAEGTDRPLIAASMFGVTTPCVERARAMLEAAGYEVLVFHATGNGGQAMELLIDEGLITGVLDITTTELADELVGGILSAGPDRLTAAGRRGVPQVISVGALDMVNFGPRETVPPRFADRRFYIHNPNVTLMRTTVGECASLGEIMGHKAAAARGPTSILFPREGVSAIDRSGQPFDDAEARHALREGICRTCGSVEFVELPQHINDPAFAEAAAHKLLDLIAAKSKS